MPLWGRILASGLQPIPKGYVHRMSVPLTLAFWDQYGDEIRVEPKLLVDRSPTPRPKSMHRRASRFDSGEIVETGKGFKGLRREGPGLPAALNTT